MGTSLSLGMAHHSRCANLRSLAPLEIGLVAGSSDAPVVDFDPLRGIRLAVTRTTASGEVLDDGQQIAVEEALSCIQSTPRDPAASGMKRAASRSASAQTWSS